MAKKKSTTEEEVIQDANNKTFEEIFEIVVSNFGHVQHNQIEELFKLLNSKK
jgi:CHASE3 domain sensor protein